MRKLTLQNSALQIDAILLAAGSSLRFGTDKRFFLIDDVPMLQHAIAAIIDAVDSVTVVLKRSDSDVLRLLLGDFFTDKRVISLWLDNPAAGMGTNLAHAIKSLPAVCDGVLVMLADMPYVQSQTVKAVVNAFEDDKIVAPVFIGGDGVDDGAEKQGHPVLFSRQFFPELEQLSGDSGARSVLQRHIQSVIFLPTSDSGILRDLDFPPV